METQETPIEQWKDVVGYEGIYEVSNLGRIKKYDKLVKLCIITSKGINHAVINLGKNGKYKSFSVGRLVVKHFICDLYSTIKIKHIDGDKSNNSVSNLQISTQRECNINPNRNKTGYVGVIKTPKGRYNAYTTMNSCRKMKHLGVFNTPEEASDVYQLERQKQLHEIMVGKDTKIIQK